MRDHYSDFLSRGAEILAVGPNDMKSFQKYWETENIPYIGLPDPDHKVARLYRQEVNIFKLGRMPLNCIVDTSGRIRYVHYSANMSDIPDNETFLNVIDELNRSSS
ncbi:MAG: redoxin domain-containing protein [Anaerolineales bacterium]|jgi:peroxiredoxin Q/BCP|nr:redoxin domain-containing protein [Anaerolineales bacterium]